MKTWFTSDRHFGHANIIKYCGRPFKDVNHMNRELVKKHNERVKPEDIVFDLGDFCFRNSKGGKAGEGTLHKADYYEEQLNGDRVKIKGNHDKNNTVKTHIEKVVIKYGGKKITLVHNPMHADSSCDLNFVGHVHEKWKFRTLGQSSFMINVGVDVWKFKPVSYEEIMREFTKWKKGLNEANVRPSGP